MDNYLIPKKFGAATAMFFLITCISASENKLLANEESSKYPVLSLKPNEVSCILLNKEKYMEIKRAIIIFNPSLCPLIGGEEVARMVQNNSTEASTPSSGKIFLNRSQFHCLISKIQSSQVETIIKQQNSDDYQIKLILDCKQ